MVTTPHHIDNLTVTLNKSGAAAFTKVSYPIRYGRYSEIKTPTFTFQFNLNHKIKYIQGNKSGWPSPSEWLKRTDGNDWVYYMAGDYSGVRDAFGEYYLPYPDYPTNAFLARNPFKNPAITGAINAWYQLRKDLPRLIPEADSLAVKRFLQNAAENDSGALIRSTRDFHKIVHGRISVLPPDTRHVDYNVIPVIIADGCLYKCGFCRLKSRDEFTPRTKKDIVNQINQHKMFFGPDLRNYNAIFLGLHDALNADAELILFAAETAYHEFDLENSYLDDAFLFLFGSVDAIIHAKTSIFDALQALPYSTYINIGLESADQQTLDFIQKPITSEMVADAFFKIQDINQTYSHIEISANFVYGDHLPSTHLPSFFDLTQKDTNRPNSKGTIYFSPLMGNRNGMHRDIVRKFYQIKRKTPLESYLYLILRL